MLTLPPFVFSAFHLSIPMLLALSLAIGLGGIITILHNQIFWSVIEATREVRIQNILCTVRVPLLSIERGTRHMRYSSVSTTLGVLCISERVLFWCWLWEPDVTTVATKVAGLECFCYVFLDDDGASRSIDEP